MSLMDLTPTQRECIERSRAFRAKIASRAVPQRPAAERAHGVKGNKLSQALDTESFPAEPDPPVVDPLFFKLTQKPGDVQEAIVWPVIPLEPIDLDGRRPKIAEIKKAVALFYRLSERALTSHRRTKDLVYPRQVCMYLCKILTVQSLPEIGRRLGDRDHTTVLHGHRKIAREILEDENLAHEVALLIEYITGVQQ